MQISLGERHRRLHLVQLRAGEEDGGYIAEGFVQSTGLRWIAGGKPSGLQPIKHRMAAFVGDDSAGRTFASRQTTRKQPTITAIVR